MTALNVEVDPKRIEAHENEEPPVYEPTDEDGIATTNNSGAVTNENGDNGGNIRAYVEGEVVEEDAEEERRAEGSAILASERSRTTTSSSVVTTENNYQDASFWPTTGGHENDENEPEAGEGIDDAGMSGFPSGEGPSMEDFFHDDSLNDNDDPMIGEGQQEEGTSATKNTNTAEPPRDNSELVSLVIPKKMNSKSRRPKIRPSSRKKGK